MVETVLELQGLTKRLGRKTLKGLIDHHGSSLRKFAPSDIFSYNKENLPKESLKGEGRRRNTFYRGKVKFLSM